ncbi:MAG: FtsQ-type POTRA domain-containing protein [Terracidiphilus sp.]
MAGLFRPGAAGRRGPGMPLEFDDLDGDGNLRPATDRFGDRFGKSKRPWWRPASTVGRVLLATAALLALGAFTTAILLVRHSLERDARFRIAGTEDIQATGLTEVSRPEMMPVFGEDIGRNVFFVPIDQRRRALEQIPWIERATVMRVLPNQIRVAVVERQPVAFTRHGEQIGLVDANGVLLGMAPATMAKHHYSFPVLTGIDAGDPADSRKARIDVYLRMMAELDADGKHSSEQISEIDLTDPEDARVLMPEQGADVLAHFGEDHFLERYQRYQAHIAGWRQQYPHLAAVDLRYDNQVVLEMASGKETAETSSGDAFVPPAAPSPVAKPVSGAKASGTKTLAAKAPGAKTSDASAAKKSKPAQDKKHAASAKRADAQSTTKRNSVSTTRPAPTNPGSNSRPARASAAIVTQGG